MPHYYFRLTDGEQVLEDFTPDPIECAGDAAARTEGLMLARDLKHRRLMPERDWEGWFVNIKDEAGNEVETLAIADAPESS